MEKYKEVKLRIETNSNTAAVSVSVTGQCSGVVLKTLYECWKRSTILGLTYLKTRQSAGKNADCVSKQTYQHASSLLLIRGMY